MIKGKRLSRPYRAELLVLFFPLALAFFSCSARIDGIVKEGGAADLILKASLQSRTAALISSLRAFMGSADMAAPVLDGPAIGRSMAASPGIKTVSLVNTTPSALDGSLQITNVGDFLASGNTKSRFVTFAEGKDAGSSSIIVILDRDSVPEFISKLSPEVSDYLSALMAPVVLGETSSAKEYLDLVASIYGRPLSDEIAQARIQAFVEFPRPITDISGGIATGKKAEFNIPLLNILVMENPLSYKVSW